MSNESERKFLHDIATPLSVAKLLMKKLVAELQTTPKENIPFEKVLERALKVENSLQKIEDLHGTHRASLGEKNNKSAA